MSLIGAPLAVVLTTLIATGGAVAQLDLAQLASPEHAIALMFGALGLMPYYAVAIVFWVVLARRFPQIDRRRIALCSGFPALVFFLFAASASALYSDYATEFTWLAIPVPLCLGAVPLLPRLLDPSLRAGAFAAPLPQSVAG